MYKKNTVDVFNSVYNVCVIGSGPAGIIFALEYTRLNPHHKVLLIEFGSPDAPVSNSLDNSIQIEDPRYHHEPYECTNKGLGGTSSTWGGRCVMYDEVDFIDRPILQGECTWNVDLFKEVKEYISITSSYFECGNSMFNLHELNGIGNNRIAENFCEGIVTDSAIERWSMPTRFGKRYAKDITERINLILIEGIEAGDFSTPDQFGKVRFLTIKEVSTGDLHQIEAESFVISAGCQESTRILLHNTQLFQNLPNIPTALGKYYQGHLSGKIASVKFKGNPDKTDFGFIKDSDTYVRRRFQFSKDFLINNNLLNTAIWLDNPLYHDPDHKNGIMSFLYLAMITPIIGKKLAPPAIANSITKGQAVEIDKHILNVIRGLPGSLTKPATIFYKRYLKRRKLPGVFLYNAKNYYALHFHSEQIPDMNNRMELASDGKTLNIHYFPKEEDIESVIKLHDVLDTWLRKCNCGELEFWYPREKLADAIRVMSKDGIHQSGTTRIADSAEKGVVDRNLKVWGTQNVFVCSSSVFPTSSQANPTYFLGAFAVRLANHLTVIMKSKTF